MSKNITKSFIMVACASLIILGCTPTTPPATAVPPKETQPAQVTKPAWEVAWDKALKSARSEGELMIYSSPAGPLMEAMGRTFGQKYGVRVDFVFARGADLPPKILAERNAGLYIADVVIAGGTSLLFAAKPNGLLGNIEPFLLLPEVTDPGAWVGGAVPYMDQERSAIGMLGQYMRFVLYNPDLVKAAELTSYKDLLDPKWKGKMVLDDPTGGGTGNNFLSTLAIHIYGLEETKEFMRQLVKQEPVFTRDRRLLAEWVARGKYPVGVGAHTEAVSVLLRSGVNLGFAKMREGSVVDSGGGGLAIPKRIPHPGAATAFVNWVLGREGHAAFVKAYGSPGARRDGPREGILTALFPDPGEKVYVDTEESLLFRGQMTKIAGEIFGPLLR